MYSNTQGQNPMAQFPAAPGGQFPPAPQGGMPVDKRQQLAAMIAGMPQGSLGQGMNKMGAAAGAQMMPGGLKGMMGAQGQGMGMGQPAPPVPPQGMAGGMNGGAPAAPMGMSPEQMMALMGNRKPQPSLY